MPTTAKRILRNGLLAALLCASLGFAFAYFAGIWFDSRVGERAGSTSGAEVTEALQWRVPLSMAGWGFAVTAVFEFFASLWRKPKAPAVPVEPAPPGPDGEALLLELLDRAEAAERDRSIQKG